MVESEKQVAGVTTPLPSASHKSDASITVRPGRKGAKKYAITWRLEDGGPGHVAVLTVFYREGGAVHSHAVRNSGNGVQRGSFTIRTQSPVTAMWAKVTREDSHESIGRGSDPNILS
ncbi:hypothetical protein ACIBHX_16905 [Nonomuraea sp. NPDC050536]|uniref:hypothetical protein n=1 Tax=Nonomuraea sp. NPDC050536 TaxID=3364366 RepID=UPI0037CAA187